MIKKFLFKNIFYKFNKWASLVNLKPKELVLEKSQKCLCICPHPDDESIGMGGLLSLYPDLFDLVLLTDGRKGIKGVSEEEAVKIREDEFNNALKIAGITDYSCLKAEDKRLLDNFELFKTVNLEKYDYIFIPNIIDQHPDHKAVSILLNKALTEGAKVKNDVKICFYEVWSALGLTNAYVDISDVIESKKAMINCYKAEVAVKDYEYYALGLNQYRGMFKDKKYVEAFCVLELKDFKNICELY